MSRAAYYAQQPSLVVHDNHHGQKIRREDMPSYSDATTKHELNRLSRTVGRGISDPPLLEGGIHHSDCWWFPPLRGNILYNDSREKFRYLGNRKRFQNTPF